MLVVGYLQLIDLILFFSETLGGDDGAPDRHRTPGGRAGNRKDRRQERKAFKGFEEDKAKDVRNVAEHIAKLIPESKFGVSS